MIGGFISRHGFLLLRTVLANTYKHTTDWGGCQGDEGKIPDKNKTLDYHHIKLWIKTHQNFRLLLYKTLDYSQY